MYFLIFEPLTTFKLGQGLSLMAGEMKVPAIPTEKYLWFMRVEFMNYSMGNLKYYAHWLQHYLLINLKNCIVLTIFKECFQWFPHIRCLDHWLWNNNLIFVVKQVLDTYLDTWLIATAEIGFIILILRQKLSLKNEIRTFLHWFLWLHIHLLFLMQFCQSHLALCIILLLPNFRYFRI